MTAVPWGISKAQARTIRLAWLGVLLITGLWAWLAVVGAEQLHEEGFLWPVIWNGEGTNVGIPLLTVVAVLLAAERLWPAVKRPFFCRAHVVDATYLLLFAVAAMPVVTLASVGVSSEVSAHAPFLFLGRLPLVPQVVAVAAILVGNDGLLWLSHVANHRFETLWRLHALHHSQEDMSVLTTFRTHPLIHATYLPALLPGLLLVSTGQVPRTAWVVYGCLVTLPHANLRWRLGPLGRVVVSPAYHRLHHARDLGLKGTVNFGFVLVLWDRLARRAEFPSGEPVPTGIGGRTVPVEQAPLTGRRLPLVVFAQLVQPFQPYSATDWRK
ncbi:MAG TPA: sterol desaturase family protein [Acidimicrobiales bacterium]|nr:sterol desaturase family protein [Acidimicrobiales bacterium]